MSNSSATAKNHSVDSKNTVNHSPKKSNRFFETLKISAFGLFKVPLILFAGPSVIDISDKRSEVRIPLGYRTKNHVGSMYFGTIAIGADLCVGLLAMRAVEAKRVKMTPVFKDFQCDFKKLAKGDVHFISEDGDLVSKAIDKAVATGERQNVPVRGHAIVPSIDPHEHVAEFKLTLSVKELSKK